MNKLAGVLTFLSVFILSGFATCRAIELRAALLPAADSTFQERTFGFEVSSFVLRTATAACEGGAPLTVDFGEKRSPVAARFYEILNRSIDFSAEPRCQLANALGSFSDVCDMGKMQLDLFLAPMTGITFDLTGRPEKNRIARLKIKDCGLDPVPEECDYHSIVRDSNGLEWEGLMAQLNACHQVMEGRYDGHEEVLKRFMELNRAAGWP